MPCASGRRAFFARGRRNEEQRAGSVGLPARQRREAGRGERAGPRRTRLPRVPLKAPPCLLRPPSGFRRGIGKRRRRGEGARRRRWALVVIALALVVLPYIVLAILLARTLKREHSPERLPGS
jgi:hypothetical protein